VITVIEIGCLARYFNPYEREVQFAKENDFRFLQIWYDKNGLLLKDVEEQTNILKQFSYTAIIHAVLDLNEIGEHVPRLVKVLKTLNHSELIIHPVCKSERITDNTIYKLADKVKVAFDILANKGISLYLENNSKLDPIFTTTQEIEIMFEINPDLEFLLDVAHIDNYKHLKEMISIRKPKILHIADRHLEVIHEHLPLGQGNIDYEFIFKNILQNYEGKVILEVAQSDEDIIYSKKLIENYAMNEI
jgi:sugar phosphate isomerase/epimerase